jgi:peroxiredoxin 1
MEIIVFSDKTEEFKKVSYQVIGASVDSHFCHLA